MTGVRSATPEREKREAIVRKVPPRTLYVLLHETGYFHGVYRTRDGARVARNGEPGWRIIRYHRGSLRGAGTSTWTKNRGIE